MEELEEELLIKKVKENQLLYNHKSTHYRNTEVRQRTWEKIGKELHLKGECKQLVILSGEGKYRLDMRSAEEAKSAWDNLRRRFVNAHNLRRTKKHKSGITIHPWVYEEDMAFLLPYVVKKRRTRDDENTLYENSDSGSVDNGGEQAATDNSAENVKTEPEEVDEDNNASTPMVFATRGTKREYPQDDDRIDFKRKCYQSNMLLEMDESDLFFMSMSKMTKSLPLLERAKVNLTVSNAVLKAIISFHGNANAFGSNKNDDV